MSDNANIVRTDKVIGGVVHLQSNGMIVAIWDDGLHKEHWDSHGRPFDQREQEYLVMLQRWNKDE